MEHGTPPAPPGQKRRLRKAVFAFAAFLFGLVCFLVFAEVFVRLADRFHWFYLAEWERIPGVLCKIRGGQPGSNSLGFRDVERTRDKSPDVFRVIFLGDSYVWGTVAREATFVTQLENILNAAGPSKRIEVLNFGVSGYGMADCADLLVNYAVQFNPDLVVQGFYYGNDLTDNHLAARRVALLGERVNIRAKSWLDKSRLSLIVCKRWNVMVYRMKRGNTTGNYVATPEDIFAINKGYMYVFDPKWIAEFNLKHRPSIAASFEVMRDYSKKSGVPIVFVSYPCEAMADPWYAREIFRAMGWGEGYLKLHQWNPIMDEFIRSYGFPHHDITEALSVMQRTERLWPPTDTHWNEAGNLAAAQCMAPFIQESISQHGVTFSAPAVPPAPRQESATAEPSTAAAP